jgi:solute carrier family 35 protein E1
VQARPATAALVGQGRVTAAAIRLTSTAAAILPEDAADRLMGLEDLDFEEVPASAVEPAAKMHPGTGAFNLMATSFLAALFYVRRKAALAQRFVAGDSSISIAPLSASPASAEPEGPLARAWRVASSIDYSLILCLAFWYIGNYYYNITNKFALKATGGVGGAPLTVASIQLLVGVIYGLFLWVAPDARRAPTTTWDDIVKMVPLSIAFAGAHFSTVFAMSAGAVSFGQIVKASEPAFAALLGVLLYSQNISAAKWWSLVPVIGGVCLASAAELDFAWAALVAGILANLFAAVKANENKKAMDTPGLKDRLGTVGNQFALTMTLAWAISFPLVLLAEWSHLPGLLKAWQTNPAVSFNTISAGLWFYLYNELATIVVKKTGAVTQSVANTAKRVIVIIACGLVLGESLDTLKLVGCGIGILGVFLYSVIDDIVKPKSPPLLPK